MVKRTPILKVAVELGSVYLLHFDIDPKEEIPAVRPDANKPFHARHYLGFATDPTARIAQHYDGQSGVKLMDAVHSRGITFTVARLWTKVDRNFERRLKNQGGLSRHCPICKALGIDRDTLRKKRVEVEVAPEAPETGPDFVEKTSATHTREDAKMIKELLQGMDLRLNLAGSVSRKGVSEHDLDFHVTPGANFSYPQFHNALRSAGFEFCGNEWNVFRNRQPEAGYDLFQYTKEEPKMKVDFFFKRNSVHEEDFLAGVKTAGFKTAYLPQEMQWFKDYLSMNDTQKAVDLAYKWPGDFVEYVQETDDADKLPQGDDPETVQEEVLNTDFSQFSADVMQGWMEHQIDYLMANNPADAPSWSTLSYEGLVKNQWLIHFTDDAWGIANNGFKFGTDDMDRAALSTWFTEASKQSGGFNFAFLLSDFMRYSGARGGSPKYGKEAVIFRASGIKIWHSGDEEPQIIFRGSEARDIVPIQHPDNWVLPENSKGRPIYQNEDLNAVTTWVVNNWAQYQQALRGYYDDTVSKSRMPKQEPKKNLPWDAEGNIKPAQEPEMATASYTRRPDPAAQPLPADQVPEVLYHSIDPYYREEILENGLKPENYTRKGVYLATNPSEDEFKEPENFDQWEVNVKGLNVEPDEGGYQHRDEAWGTPWYVVHQDISPDRLRLLKKEAKTAAEPWEMRQDEYAGRWNEQETEEQSHVRHQKNQDWEQNALAALSLGKITPEQAKERGVYEAKNFKPLPQGPLYHVTTAKSKVESEGLRSRYELGQNYGKGLGGGTSMSISFTDDYKIAEGIYENLLIARKVAAGEMTLDDLIDTATKGVGANRPWIDDIIRSLGGSNPNDKINVELDAIKRGVAFEHGLGRPPDDPAILPQYRKPGPWRPTPWSQHWKGGDGEEKYTYWERDLNEQEKRERVFEFFKKWSFWREQAGGGLDPLYFMSDPSGLAQVPENEIAIMQFKALPGAMGTVESALGEWRVYTGAAVQLVGKANAAHAASLVRKSSGIVKYAFYIEVPQESRSHFWDEPPAHNLEFWAFKGRPSALPNEKVYFTFDRVPVAETTVLKVEKPGQSKCELSGKYETHWKLYWEPAKFTKYAAMPNKWYHGTSAKNAEKIMKDGWLRPDQETIYDIDLPRDGAVYIAELAIAEQYAIERTRGDQKGVVLQVAAPNIAQLLPDEDDVYELLNDRGGELNRKGQGIAKQVKALWLQQWNEENASYNEPEKFPIYKSFEEAWQAWGEIEFEGSAELAEQMKYLTDYIVKKSPQLARAIIELSGKAAHMGPLKVVKQIKMAAPKSVWYHGTSIKNLQSIMSQGLIPEGTEKVWSQDPDASAAQVDRTAYGGIYVTQNLLTATGSPKDTQEQGGLLLCILELQPNTMYLDEDSIVGPLNAPIKHLSDNEFHVLCYYLAATQGGASEEWNKEIEGMRGDYIYNAIAKWQREFEKKKLPFHADLKKRLEETLPAVWLAALARKAGHYRDNYAYIRAWDQVFYGTEKQKARPEINTVLPTAAEGEKSFREAVEPVTRTLRLMARPEQGDQTYNINTARLTEPIGFSGSNHILALLEIRDTRKARGEDYSQPAQMILHWGTIPQDFWTQWQNRHGSKYELIDARKGDQKPKAKGMAASAHEDDPQVFYHGTNWEPAGHTAPTLYHGTCRENAEVILKNGWAPNQVSQGGNMGQSKCLYLSTQPEDAEWFANEKGCDTVIEVRNVPMSSLAVDPEDGTGETLEEELSNKLGLPGKVVVTKSLDKSHFRIYSNKTAATDKSLHKALQALAPAIATAAQTVYDSWTQDEDDDFGGGICDAIASEIQGIIVSNIPDVNVTDGGHEGDDHAWSIAYTNSEVYGVDITPSVYETGGGYNWTKREGVTIDPTDVDIWPIDVKPSDLHESSVKTAALTPKAQAAWEAIKASGQTEFRYNGAGGAILDNGTKIHSHIIKSLRKNGLIEPGAGLHAWYNRTDDFDYENPPAWTWVVTADKTASAPEDDPQVFYHATNWNAASLIDREGLKASDNRLTDGKKYIWCSIGMFAAKSYGQSLVWDSEDSEKYAVVEFVWDYNKSEPDPEHFEEGDVYRRIEGDVPRAAINKIYYFDDDQVVKTAGEEDKITITQGGDGRITAKHVDGTASGTMEDREGLAKWFGWNDLPKEEAQKYDKAFVLGSITVKVTTRRRGIGRQLLGAVLDAAKAQGAQVCFLLAQSLVGVSQSELDAFYTNVGFQPIQRNTYMRKLARHSLVDEINAFYRVMASLEK